MFTRRSVKIQQEEKIKEECMQYWVARLASLGRKARAENNRLIQQKVEIEGRYTDRWIISLYSYRLASTLNRRRDSTAYSQYNLFSVAISLYKRRAAAISGQNEDLCPRTSKSFLLPIIFLPVLQLQTNFYTLKISLLV